jgi:polar amino acid transport system permease protein
MPGDRNPTVTRSDRASWLWQSAGRPVHPLASWVLGAAILLGFAGLLTALLMLSGTGGNWGAVWRYRTVFVQGWVLTIGLSVGALFLSMAFAALLVVLRRSPFLPGRVAATLVVEGVRGSPLLVLILILFYVVAPAVAISDRLVVGLLALSLFSAAYISEMLRAGIESVASSQLDAARAIGLSSWQTYRFVIIPQALRQTLPPLAGQFASLIKDSSLLSVIGLSEFTHSALQINSATYGTIEVFLPLALGYLALTLPISLFARYLEGRFRYDT